MAIGEGINLNLVDFNLNYDFSTFFKKINVALKIS